MRVRLKYRRLAEELARRPISHNRWAQTLGFSSGHLSDLVNGRRPYPAAETRRKLMEGLDLPFDELFEVRHAPQRRTTEAGRRTLGFVDASRDRMRSRPERPTGGNPMDSLFRDFRYAARGLLRTPGFTLAAIVTLAIGIASNTALFSIVDSILWKPYPYADGERLIAVQSAVSSRGLRWRTISYPDFLDLAEQSELLDSLAAWDWEPYGLSGGDEPVRVGGTRVTSAFFDVLGVPPLSGRTFGEEDDQPGAERVVILTEGLWRSYFGGDEDIVGRSILVNARPTTVIAIMPGGTEYPDQTRLWMPMAFTEEIAPRGANFLGTIGKMRPGADLATVAAEIQGIGVRLAEDFPEANQDRIYRAVSLRQLLTEEMRPMTLSLLGVVTFVLLIVCANVANLFLARGATRVGEVAIRRALGASGRRLAQMLLSEAMLLAAVGGLLGFGLGWLGVHRLVAALQVEIPPWVKTSMDLRIVAYTLGITLAAGLIFSLFPLLQSFKTTVSSALHEGSSRHGVGVRGGRLRASLVVSEVALSLVLLAGAGLMVKSLLDLGRVDPGFETTGALSVGLDLLSQIEDEPVERAQTLSAFLDRFAAAPGVEAVGAIDYFPLKNRSGSVAVTIEGQSVDEARQNPAPLFGRTTPGYFEAMGIPRLRGDDFESILPQAGPQQAIVSEDLAGALWPGADPIGQRLRLGFSEVATEEDWITVRGVVGDIHHRGLERQRQTHLYLPYSQVAPARMVVIVRHSGEASEAADAVRIAASEIDPHQPLHELMTVEDVVEASVWQWRFFTNLSWLFGGVALLLALVGLYGVMSYIVSQRTSEVGIRMALGAGSGAVVALILRQGGRMVLLGLAIGLPLALGLSKALSGFVYSVSAFEPIALLVAAALMAALALPALVLPARRAARIDPSRSLRAD